MADMMEIDGEDLCRARDVIRRGRTVLVRTPPAGDEPSRPWRWPRNVAESIGDCAVVPLSALTGSDFQPYPLIAGPAETILFLCASADPLPPEPFPYKTAALRTNYREFRGLWLSSERSPVLKFFEDGQVVRYFYEIGTLLGRMHSDNFLHGDAHIGNWGVSTQQGGVVIGDNNLAVLFCSPSPAQCATDIYPLLRGLEPADWWDFRRGYVTAWPAGQRSIDQIQLSDSTGWATAFRSRDFAGCIDLVDLQLESETDEALRVMLLANRVLAMGCCGRHEEAARLSARCTELSAVHSPHATRNVTALLKGILLMLQGDHPAAAHALGGIFPRPEQVVLRLSAKDAQLPLINL